MLLWSIPLILPDHNFKTCSLSLYPLWRFSRSVINSQLMNTGRLYYDIRFAAPVPQLKSIYTPTHTYIYILQGLGVRFIVL